MVAEDGTSIPFDATSDSFKLELSNLPEDTTEHQEETNKAKDAIICLDNPFQ